MSCSGQKTTPTDRGRKISGALIQLPRSNLEGARALVEKQVVKTDHAKDYIKFAYVCK
jgi:hypothetical protein